MQCGEAGQLWPFVTPRSIPHMKLHNLATHPAWIYDAENRPAGMMADEKISARMVELWNADQEPAFRGDKTPSMADMLRISGLAEAAIRHARTYASAVDRVTIWLDGRWQFSTEDHDVPQFQGSPDTSPFEALADALDNLDLLPFSHQLVELELPEIG